jgi:hypothetical protein
VHPSWWDNSAALKAVSNSARVRSVASLPEKACARSKAAADLSPDNSPKNE